MFKSEKISQIKETFNVSSKVLGLFWKTSKILFIANLIAVLIPAVVPFVTAYIFKLVIDLVVASIGSGSVDFNKLYWLIASLLVTSYLQRMSFTVQDYVTKYYFIKFPITLYSLVLNKISQLDLQYFEDSAFKDTLEKVKENYTWRPLQMTWEIFYLLQSVVQVLVALYAILNLNPILAILITIIATPDLINQVLFSKFSFYVWDKDTPNRKKFTYLTDLLQQRDSIKELKIFQTGSRFLKEISGIQQKFFNESKGLLGKQLKLNTGFNLLDTLVLNGIVVYVVLEAIAKRITVGDISFYQNVISNFNNGMGGLFRNVSRVFENSLYVKYIFDVLELPPKIIQSEKPTKVDFDKTPEIEFKNVTFTYPSTKQKILNDFSLTIKPGEKIAFVGENGVGKTTLIKLLARFYDVDTGEILINGINLKKLDLESWYKSMGILFQDFVKYEYPVKENIFFGRVWEAENIKAIIDAAKSAGADPMIKKFDQEYQQMLGRTFEGGLELSGGQWQKIALARAFFRNAPVLILDEPTASSDAKAEAEIFNKVEKLSKDKTVIIISHRFSTVRNADKIYVIDGGKIVESGSHEELMKEAGQYASLFKLQAKGYQ